MKSFKKRSLAAFCTLLLCVTGMFVGCGKTDEIPAEQEYTVTVQDAFGTPYTTGVIVKFMNNGRQVAMQPCDANGVAKKTLLSNDYSVELSFTDTEATYYYDKNVTLSATTTSAVVEMANTPSGEPTVLTHADEEYDMYALSTGCTYVKTVADKRNYFVFTPTQAGVYEFSVIKNAEAVIGYYGAPHFVQETSMEEVVDNKFTISVKAAMIGSGDGGTASYVIGVDNKTEGCVIGIKRIGDPEKTIEDEPWTIYEKTVELQAYTLPEGAQLQEFDLEAATDTYKLVFNETDGFYHLDNADGPLVLVRLAEDSDYIASFATMLDRSGVSKYFYDENGEFEKRESYSECLLEYIDYVDEVEGVYPLTKDLEYIIKQRGDYAGWWNIEHAGYIFKDLNGNNDSAINAELAWLLMCCYIG